jgi:radical SAM-linked protein
MGGDLSAALIERVLPLVQRPARYVGGELGGVRAAWDPDRANILLAFPDAYEIGMSHTGLRVLYDRLSRLPGVFPDLAFAPWPDMEAMLRAEGLPLFGLQSRRPARQFDLLGFSLAYELTYTNLLTMLDLAGLPLQAAERGRDDPIVVAGGACALNPGVVGPFCDLLFLGDGEEGITEMAAAVIAWKREGGDREDLLSRLDRVEGVWRSGRGPVRSRKLPDLDRCAPPRVLVPLIEPVHDRMSVEVMRGCTRGCRFCQAGMINRPVRERGATQVIETAAQGILHGGWDEVSLLSLSASDYSGLDDVIRGLRGRLEHTHTNLVLPSLRIGTLADDQFRLLGQEAPTTFTFAPEAGSQRLRNVINKQLTRQEILTGVEQAFAGGARSLKLYFMIGLPTETEADLAAIVELVAEIVRRAPRGAGQVTVSISPFAPKPHTPFQWAGQIPLDEIERRNVWLAGRLRRLRVKVGLRDARVSQLEALLGIGDGRLTGVVSGAWRRGARFDGWTEWFRPEIWREALAGAGVDPAVELAPRDPQAALPWDDVLAGVSGDFLRQDWERARAERVLPDCRLQGSCYDCAACGPEPAHRFATRARLEETRPAGRKADLVDAGPMNADSRDGGPQEGAPATGRDRRTADHRSSGEARRQQRWSRWRRQAADRCWYRMEYCKTGDVRFLGHLDLQRQLQLALRRSGLPVAYSQGYHPHLLLKFGPPLPLGVEGERELLDLALAGELDDWEAALNEQLPAGLRIRRAVPWGAVVPSAIDQSALRLDYEAATPQAGDGSSQAALGRRVEAFLAAERWPHRRERPRGAVEVDARALVVENRLFLREEEAGMILRFSLLSRAGAASLPVQEFLGVLGGELLAEPRLCQVRRLACLCRGPDGGWRSPLAVVEDHRRRYRARMRLQD